MLFDRDYTRLTDAESKQIEEAKLFLIKNGDKVTSYSVLEEYNKKLPEAFYYNDSIFPNNYLDIGKLKDKVYLDNIHLSFTQKLENNITERQILNFINENKFYPLIGSIFNAGYDFGHHEAFLFKEFEITSTYKSDYLLIGKNSGGYELVFVELENPTGNITKSDGTLGRTFRKGIEQVGFWNSWIEKHYHTLKLVFGKFLGENKSIPNELIELDKSRIHFVVVAGRRTDFNQKTYEIRRRMLDENKIRLLHYDNLLDNLLCLKSKGNY